MMLQYNYPYICISDLYNYSQVYLSINLSAIVYRLASLAIQFHLYSSLIYSPWSVRKVYTAVLHSGAGDARTTRTMVLMLNGNPEIDAHVWCEIGNFI